GRRRRAVPPADRRLLCAGRARAIAATTVSSRSCVQQRASVSVRDPVFRWAAPLQRAARPPTSADASCALRDRAGRARRLGRPHAGGGRGGRLRRAGPRRTDRLLRSRRDVSDQSGGAWVDRAARLAWPSIHVSNSERFLTRDDYFPLPSRAILHMDLWHL